MPGTRPHSSQRSGDPPVDRARHRHTPLPQQRALPALVTLPTYRPGPSPQRHSQLRGHATQMLLQYEEVISYALLGSLRSWESE
jgi:hypothetical protein